MARRLLLVCLLLLSSCGYTTKRIQDFPRARTIAIMPFDNLGYRRDLALRLTQAVAREVRARTSLALGSPQSADLILSGRMNARERVVIQDEDRTAIQKRLDGVVDITVTERATGRVVRQAAISAHEEFRPGQYGESLEGSATDEWVRRVAERIVHALERGF